jgi:hypothetical protein
MSPIGPTRTFDITFAISAAGERADHHDQAHRDPSLVCFSSISKAGATCRRTCQRDKDICDGSRSEAIGERNALRKKQDPRGYVTER